MRCIRCGYDSELECPSCDQLFCISCFVDHGKSCYGQLKKQAEQKKCSICGRYAFITPTVHCSDCQIEICRSCLYAHRKTHEEEKKKCSGCNGNPAGPFVSCPDCGRELCEACMEIHRTRHGTWQSQSKPKYRCFSCGTPTTTECDECKKPYCESCFDLHQAVHEPKHTCMWCSNPAPDACLICGTHYCDAHKASHAAIHTASYNTRREYGRINLDDFQIYGVKFTIDEEVIKNLKESMEWANKHAEEARRQARAEEERKRQEQKAKEEAEREAFYHNFNYWRYDFGSWTTDEEEETDAYKSHYTGQQSQSHSQYSRQQTRTSAPSQELEKAFKLLQLSTRATVQEVKRAFRRQAKSVHPDVGGTKEQFVKLNNAYELALSHAERNER